MPVLNFKIKCILKTNQTLNKVIQATKSTLATNLVIMMMMMMMMMTMIVLKVTIMIKIEIS